jgi:hypothetical protein
MIGGEGNVSGFVFEMDGHFLDDGLGCFGVS